MTAISDLPKNSEFNFESKPTILPQPGDQPIESNYPSALNKSTKYKLLQLSLQLEQSKGEGSRLKQKLKELTQKVYVKS